MSSATVLELSKELAAHLAPYLDTSRTAAYVIREIRADTHAGSRKEWNDVETSIEGLSRSARVRVQDDLAEALDGALRTLRAHKTRGEAAWEGETPIKMSNLPDHVQLLLNLADRPTSKTLDLAHDYLHRPLDNGPSPDELLYREIMSEPFTGSHWEKGYDEEVKHGWTDSESSSGDSDVEVITPSTGKIRSTLLGREELRRLEEEAAKREDEERLKVAEETLRAFEQSSHWLQGGTKLVGLETGLYGWRSLTTQASSIQLDAAISATQASDIKIVSATVLQRELLLALSGRPGVFLDFDEDWARQIVPGHPQVPQFSSASLNHILEYISFRASQAAHIRAFIADAGRPQPSSSRSTPRICKTTQAFAEACREVMAEFESWIADIETQMLRGVVSSSSESLPATPLSLRLDLEHRFGPGLDHLTPLLDLANSPISLLNELFATLMALPNTRSTLRKSVLRVFVSSVEPMWQLLGVWLVRGMPLPSGLSTDSDEVHQSLDDEEPLDPEFFIERDRDVSWTDDDFWENGYVTTSEGLPSFLGEGIEELILEAGKARGLLKAFETGQEKQAWTPFQQVLKDGLEDVNLGEISGLVLEYIVPKCRLATFHLQRALREDCGLDLHLDAIEGLFFINGYEVMNEWITELFSKIQQRRQWSDFQTLTSSLRDIIEARGVIWMNPSALRIQAKRTRPDAGSPVTALGQVRATYDVPFPLSQLFTPTSMDLRSEVFGLLLQVRYAHNLLLESRKYDTRLLPGGPAAKVKVASQVRQQFLWFFSTLLSWLSRNVIAVQTARFKETLKEATSLKSMIALELEHVRLIYGFAFLHTKTEELHEKIMTILELCVASSRAYAACMNDSASSNQKASGRRNGPITYSQAVSDDESENDEDEEADQSGYLDEDDLGTDMSTMRYKLNRTIATFSEGVEALAAERVEGDGARSSETWGELAFALAEWQRFQS